jgi:L-threonylcarbamoyladenylate synthase
LGEYTALSPGRYDISVSIRQDTERLREDEVARAAELLRGGGTVAFPTETVYGLGANALDPIAVAKIFEAKERPGWDPLIVHVSDLEMLSRVALASPAAGALVLAFWPGPLTLLLPRTAAVPDAVTAGRPLVGVRIPRHPLALRLIEQAGVPIAAPSANRFGRTSPTTAAHVLEDLDGRIDAVLEGGPTEVGVESTVFDVASGIIYRPGAVTAAMIAAVIGSGVEVYKAPVTQAAPESLPSPGVGMRHYAPRARLVLVADEDEMQERLGKLLGLASQTGERVGVMLPKGWAATPGAVVFPWAAWKDAEGLAHGVFAGLRELDGLGVGVIVCPLPKAGGVGAATRDRLEKAARR